MDPNALRLVQGLLVIKIEKKCETSFQFRFQVTYKMGYF